MTHYVIDFILDKKYVSCSIPSEAFKPHSKNHSKSCKKNHKKTCRFNFPKPPSLSRHLLLLQSNILIAVTKYLKKQKIVKVLRTSLDQGTKKTSTKEYDRKNWVEMYLPAQ
ncbi:hypothetical protein HOLleu_24535 [Holothuria leucospilota]|uniref:Uncharacterized protein n=1 Tax=Holothuria leucospilota TaxID=206669 RepID=A0A9Q1BWW7_HOLLE|nr:hypothetical protein HOLleu_24535 [Holothuria leucospilota]